MGNLAHAVKSVTLGMPFLFRGHPYERAGIERLASRKLGAVALRKLGIGSPAFEHGAPMPKQSAALRENLSPPLRFHGVPKQAASLVLLVEDPDAPTVNPFVHWLVYGLPPHCHGLPEGVPVIGWDVALQGTNSMLIEGYTGPVPPKGDVAHGYHFQLFALNRKLGLAPGAGRAEVLAAMDGHLIGFGEIVGRFERP